MRSLGSIKNVCIIYPVAAEIRLSGYTQEKKARHGLLQSSNVLTCFR
jgi:hypothetical protein